MFENLWRQVVSWNKTGKNRHPAKKPSRRMLRLELLEDRCLMATAIAGFSIAAGGSPYGITSGTDGNVWFSERQAGQIGMINPTTHAVSEFPIPTANSSPAGITGGPDGNIWFTESNTNKIGLINLSTHAVTEFAIPTANSQPVAITTGPDGNLWFTEMGAGQIASINPTTHVITEFAIPSNTSSPVGITAGPDGNLWFTENNHNKIASMNPITHDFAEYALPTSNSQPYWVTAGADGNLWFTEKNSNKIGAIDPTSHAITELVIPTGGSGAAGITAGADDNLWFTEFHSNKIGTVNLPSKLITEITIPTAGSSPLGITVGPAGTLWFAEANRDQIGEVVAGPTVTATPVNTTIVAGQTATFVAAATVGFPTPTVQWQVSTNGGITFTPLSNGGVYSGVTTGTLTVTGATTAMTGYQFDAVFSNSVGPSATTAPAILTVNSVLSILPALPQGTPGTNYNQTISVVGGTTPFTLFLVNNFNGGGTGLTFANLATNSVNGTITINGMPTAPGVAAFTVAVANTAGDTLTQNLVITISPPLSIATSSLPAATAGISYHQMINVNGGAMPYTNFSVTNFNADTTGLIAAAITALPGAGTFTINATPVAGGIATFTVNVTDSAGVTVTKNYTINVNPPLVITPALPPGTAGTKYQQTVTATGGGVPYTSLTVTNFNAGTTGLTLGNITTNASTGAITINGIPSAAGVFTLTAKVVDALGAALSKTYTVTINPALTITPALPQGTVGANYHQTITVAGGSTPSFTITGFSAGATGLTSAVLVANAAVGTIALQGTPTAPGTLAFTVNVTDSAGSSVTRAFAIVINPAPNISNLTATQWTAGAPGFPGILTITGGTGPYTLAGVAGAPTGVTAFLNGSTIAFAGTPTQAGTFASGSVTIRDAAGASVTKLFSLTINATPTISNLSATQWTSGRPGFNGVMTVAGGTGAVTIVSSGGLPTGMALTMTGNTIGFTGTPSGAPSFAGSVTLRDAIGATVTRTFSIAINAVPTLGNLTMTQWTAGKPGFTGIITIGAGTGPFTVTSASGLPTGLTAVVSGNTIQFTGTPSVAQSFAAGSITIRDAAGATITKTFGIVINPPVVLTTVSFPPSALALLYTAPVNATGGTGAVTFMLTAGSLPPGMKLRSNGILSGATRGFGSFTFTITATDAVGATFSKQYTLSISRRA